MNPLDKQTAQQDAQVKLLVKFIYPNGDPVDISAATEKTIILQYPNKSSLDFAAEFYTDGTDGAIVYTTEDGDLDQVGSYFIEGRVVIDSIPLETRNNQINNELVVYANVGD